MDTVFLISKLGCRQQKPANQGTNTHTSTSTLELQARLLCLHWSQPKAIFFDTHRHTHTHTHTRTHTPARAPSMQHPCKTACCLLRAPAAPPVAEMNSHLRICSQKFGELCACSCGKFQAAYIHKSHCVVQLCLLHK